MSPTTLTIERLSGRREGVRILRLTGQFTLSTLGEFQTLVREGAHPVTIVDLSGVPFIDSAAVGALLGFHASCAHHQRRYALTGISDRLRSIFRTTGIGALLVIYSSVEDAEERTAAD